MVLNEIPVEKSFKKSNVKLLNLFVGSKKPVLSIILRDLFEEMKKGIDGKYFCIFI